jgi:decaprenylphospho-beta-D-ribofuranose 2-oxidase
MSSVELPTRATPASAPARQAVISGFGRTRPVAVTVLRPRDAEEVAELLAEQIPSRGLIARGAGLSYGDAAQNEDGIVLDTSALAGVQALDSRSGDVTVGAGMRVSQLLERLAANGLTLPVVPGTSGLTVGGAIASDVHGKNHPRDGSFGSRLTSMTVCTPAEGPLEVSREQHPELFAATLGGIGLTGVITAATLQTIVLRRPAAVADIDRVDSLEQALELLADDQRHSHAIAWLDLLVRGNRFTRAIVTRSREGEEATGPTELRPASAVELPARVPGGLLRPSSVRAFNRLLWLRTPRRARERPMEIGPALFPLDRLDGWNRLYGRGGLVQYQVAVPRGEEWTLRCLLEMLRAQRLPMYLASLKRLGPGSGGLLSFPIEGWTVAIDMPARAAGLEQALAKADLLVTGAGGRVYLAKDSRMSPETLAAGYPELPAFQALRSRLDPHELLRSDMSRRLGMTR